VGKGKNQIGGGCVSRLRACHLQQTDFLSFSLSPTLSHLGSSPLCLVCCSNSRAALCEFTSAPEATVACWFRLRNSCSASLYLFCCGYTDSALRSIFLCTSQLFFLYVCPLLFVLFSGALHEASRSLVLLKKKRKSLCR
jgi:hypothetical protein